MKKNRGFWLAFIFFVLTCTVFAQALRGRIEGVVKDQQGQAVPNVSIVVTNVGTGETLQATTTSEGSFAVPEVKPGTYTVSAEAQGFKKTSIEGIIVQVATVSSMTIDLEVGAVSEQVTVSADEAQVVINTSNPEVGEVVDRQKILELPLDGRNPFELTALQAGVETKATGDGEITKFSINGNRTVANNLTVDGVNSSDAYLKTPANITLSLIPVSVESIAEFRVTTALPSAEFGRGTTQINAVTASGTNRFRGSAFIFHRNTIFNANNFFNNSTILENGESVAREPLIRNQFGGRFSGPISRDRTFFFVSYEGKRESRGVSRNRLVYTEQARRGIFRYLKGRATTPANVALATATAPASSSSSSTVTCRTTGTSAVPVGSICVQNVLGLTSSNPARTLWTLDPTTQAYLGQTPLPNNFQIGDGLNTGGYRFNAKILSPSDQFSGRFDHRFNDNHTIEAILNYGNVDILGDYINGGEERFPDLPYGTRKTVGRGLSTAFRSIISPKIVNEARFGAQISGLNFGNEADFSGGFRYELPTVTNPLYDLIATGRKQRVLQWADNVTIVQGNHTFKTGAEVRSSWVNRYSFAGVLPTIDFDTINDPGFSQSTQFSGSGSTEYLRARLLANVLTGAVGTITQGFNVVNPEEGIILGAPKIREYSNWDIGFYLQDSWRARPNLTLNLGVRYDLYTPVKEANNMGLLPVGGSAGLYGISGAGNLFEPGTLTGTRPVLDFAPGGKLYRTDKNNIAPVLGFAWDPFNNGKASIRGGYRISYFQGNYNAIDNILDSNEGLVITTTRTVNSYLRNGVSENPLPTYTIPAPQSIQTNFEIDIRAFDEKLQTPYVHDFIIGAQYEIFKKTSLEVRYVGNRGKKLYRGYDINEVNIFAKDPVTGQTFLDAFKIAQNNLNVFRAARDAGLVSANAADNFAYNPALAGSLQNPLMDALFTGQTSGTGNNYLQSTFIARLDEGRAGDFADYVSRIRLLSGVRGGSFLNAVNAGRLPANFFRANPDVRGAQLFTNGSVSSYDSLQVELTRRLSGGLRFQASYTFAKGLSDFTGSLADVNSFLTLRDTHREYAVFTNSHQISANVLYQLPFGRGQKYFTKSKGFVRRLVGGWQIGSIVKYTSGDPLSITSGRGTYNRDARSASNTVDVVGNLSRSQLNNLVGIQSTADGIIYIDPNFAPGSTNDPSEVIFLNPQAGTLGSLGLSSITGPRYFNVDFNVLKRTRINERMNVEFRAEIFNLFNTVNFDNPNTDINSANFGRITGIVGKPRLMQFSLRLNF